MYTNESQENQNDASSDSLGFENLGGGNKKNSGEKSDGSIKFNLKLKERLFLFAFDLIEVNSIFNQHNFKNNDKEKSLEKATILIMYH